MKIKNTTTILNERITCFVYGPSGIGKTTLAGTLPGKTIIISSESGLLSLGGKDIDYYDIGDDAKTPTDKLDNLRKAFASLKEETAYQNVFVDSLSEISQIVVSHFKTLYPDKKESMLLWGAYNDLIRTFIKSLRDLRPYNVIITCLDKVDKDELGRRYRTPDMAGSIAHQVTQYFDEVFYYTSIEDEKERKRVLFTSSSDNLIAKDRSGKLEKLESPDLNTVFEKIRS